MDKRLNPLWKPIARENHPGLQGMADRVFETLRTAFVGHEPSYERADLCFKQLTIYAFNVPDVLAT